VRVLVDVINPFFFWVLKNEPDILTNEPFYIENCVDMDIGPDTGILQIAAFMNFFGNDPSNEWSKTFHAKMGAYAGTWSNKGFPPPLVEDMGGTIEGYFDAIVGTASRPRGRNISDLQPEELNKILINSNITTLFDHTKEVKFVWESVEGPVEDWVFPNGSFIEVEMDKLNALNFFVERGVSIPAINYTTLRLVKVMEED